MADGLRMTERPTTTAQLHDRGIGRRRLAGAAAPAQRKPAMRFGLWLTKDRDAKVRVSDCGGSLCGTIVWLVAADRQGNRQAGHRQDESRPCAAQSPDGGRPDFRHAAGAANRWTGAIYNADDGKTYSGSVELLDRQPAQDPGLPRPVLRSRDLDADQLMLSARAAPEHTEGVGETSVSPTPSAVCRTGRFVTNTHRSV